MPRAPRRPCAAPGCAALAIHGRHCAAHHDRDQQLERERRAAHDRTRPSATARGYGQVHRRWRALILARDPVCVACERAVATEADHINGDNSDRRMANGQGLCKPCHSRKTMREQRRFG